MIDSVVTQILVFLPNKIKVVDLLIHNSNFCLAEVLEHVWKMTPAFCNQKAPLIKFLIWYPNNKPMICVFSNNILPFNTKIFFYNRQNIFTPMLFYVDLPQMFLLTWRQFFFQNTSERQTHNLDEKKIYQFCPHTIFFSVATIIWISFHIFF